MFELSGRGRMPDPSVPRTSSFSPIGLPLALSSSGSLYAACSDWRDGLADSMLARATTEANLDAGYTTAGDCPTVKTSINFLPLGRSQHRNG